MPSRRLWSPLASVAALAVPGGLALATGQVFLFASLGPTAVIIAHEPKHPSSRPYAVVVSHVVGLACGFAAVALFGLAHAPSVFQSGHVNAARFGAALLAILAAVALELALDAPHPPAASTTLLCALGSFHPTWHDTGLVLGGVLTIAAAGEVLRRLRLRYKIGTE